MTRAVAPPVEQAFFLPAGAMDGLLDAVLASASAPDDLRSEPPDAVARRMTDGCHGKSARISAEVAHP